jgi:hypothetical protein
VIRVPERLVHEEHDGSCLTGERFIQNPLIGAIKGVFDRISNFKERARSFYFDVILSPYRCPSCQGRLFMTGQSQCSCSCGNHFDPTLAFEKSPCCEAQVTKRTFHYACTKCNRVVPSRFLFDERVFDREYFKEMMKKSRKKAKEKREEIRRLLAESRSSDLYLMEEPDLDSIPGLVNDLDDYISAGRAKQVNAALEAVSRFSMVDYRSHILSILGWGSVSFKDIQPLMNESRQDRVWRFITLVFMHHDGEVDLKQDGYDLWVRKIYHEADG